MAKTYFEIDLGNEDLTEVEFTGKVSVVNNGIGAYEYWGQKCRDDYYEPECEEFDYDRSGFTPAEIVIIEAWCEANGEKVIAALIEDFCND